MTGVDSPKPGFLRASTVLCVVAGLCLLAARVVAEAPVTAVLYPDIREPFRSVFLSIAKGIEGVGVNVRLRAVTNEESIEDIRDWLRQNRVQAVIALGSRGQSLSDELSSTVPVVLGAVHMSPSLQGKQYYGISLSPDPTLLLQRLRELAPRVTRVTLVYQKDRDYWMVERGIQPAQRMGFTLNAIPVEKLQEAAAKYREIFGSLNSETDALWLSQDSAVLDEQAVLPMILQEAWDRKLIVFSSNPSHVKRGILFAMYPDNERMGRSLGAMAIRVRDRDAAWSASVPKGMLLLQDLAAAFNVRTAGHLGIRYTTDTLNEFDLVFPMM